MKYKWRTYENGIEKAPVNDPKAEESIVKKIHWAESGTIFVCQCDPDAHLEYRLHNPAPGRFIFKPRYNDGTPSRHAPDCGYNTGFLKIINSRNPIQKDMETGDLSATVYENISERPVRNKPLPPEKPINRVWNPGEQQQQTTACELMRTLNLDISERIASGFKDKDLDGFNRAVYIAARETTDIRHSKRALNENGFGQGQLSDRKKNGEDIFIYEQLMDIACKKADTWESITGNNLSLDDIKDLISKGVKGWRLTTRYTKKKAGKPGEDDRIEIKQEQRYVTISAMLSAIRNYKNIYKTGAIHPNRMNIMAFGYAYPVPNFRSKMIDRLWLLKVSSKGIYCESDYEVEGISAIERIISMRPGYSFYKPGRFGATRAYGIGNYIEDGVIQGRCHRKIGILEIFGICGNETYTKTAEWKKEQIEENKGKYVFIPWYPNKKESIKELEERVIKAITEIESS